MNLTAPQIDLLFVIVDTDLARNGEPFIFVKSNSGGLCYSNGFCIPINAVEVDFRQLAGERCITIVSVPGPGLSGKPTQLGIETVASLRRVGPPSNGIEWGELAQKEVVGEAIEKLAGARQSREPDQWDEIQRELDRDALETSLIEKFAREQIMGKRRYPTELYHPSGRSRVTFSPEEHAKLRIEGWREEREEGKEYRVWTADQISQTPTQTPDKPIANETSEQRKVRRALRLKTAQERWHPIAKRKIAFSWVHAAAGVDHKDAYNGWKDGTLPDSSSMVVSIDRILNQPEPPKRPVKNVNN